MFFGSQSLVKRGSFGLSGYLPYSRYLPSDIFFTGHLRAWIAPIAGCPAHAAKANVEQPVRVPVRLPGRPGHAHTSARMVLPQEASDR